MGIPVHVLVRGEVELGDVLGVGVGLDGRDDLAAFVVVAVGELVPGDDHLHAEVPEQVLVVVAPRAADEGECGLSCTDLPVLFEGRGDPGSLAGDDLLGLLDELRVAEAFAPSAAATGSLPRRR